MTEKEIFNIIAHNIIDIMPQNTEFSKAVLEIKRLVANIGFTGFYIDEKGVKSWLDIFSLSLDEKHIEELYELTQNHLLEHKDWNRFNFTLFPEGKFEVEYIWDQELQDEVDGYNNVS